jgi:hypothetical protein
MVVISVFLENCTKHINVRKIEFHNLKLNGKYGNHSVKLAVVAA